MQHQSPNRHTFRVIPKMIFTNLKVLKNEWMQGMQEDVVLEIHHLDTFLAILDYLYIQLTFLIMIVFYRQLQLHKPKHIKY